MNIQFGRLAVGGGGVKYVGRMTPPFLFYVPVSRLLFDLAQPCAVNSMEQRFLEADTC